MQKSKLTNNMVIFLFKFNLISDNGIKQLSLNLSNLIKLISFLL